MAQTENPQSEAINVGVLTENVRHNEKAIDIMRIDIDRRFDKVDARFEKVDARFDKVDARFDKVDAELKDLRKDVNTRFFQLLLGVIASVLAPIVIELAKHYL